ncbi:MAG: ribosome biogenesis GTPase YlqF [Pseudohongiellaceae bacterium]
MAISWYPGHMYKANKELIKLVKTSDLIIELLDARAPKASMNPLLSSLGKPMPRIIILNKCDLADPVMTEKWRHYFEIQLQSQANALAPTVCLTNTMHAPVAAAALATLARKLIVTRPKFKEHAQLIITGIPNVGKSTFINNLIKRKVAKTGNEPAITKGQQRIKLDETFYLVDTPGLMWPKLEDQVAAYKLATLGTIRNTAIDIEDIAWFAAEHFLAHQFSALKNRYNFDNTLKSPEQLLGAIAASIGATSKGGKINFHKVSETLLNDLRSGKLGTFSMESPPEPEHSI